MDAIRGHMVSERADCTKEIVQHAFHLTRLEPEVDQALLKVVATTRRYDETKTDAAIPTELELKFM